MKLVVLGATGGTGLELVRKAIEHGHSVTASESVLLLRKGNGAAVMKKRMVLGVLAAIGVSANGVSAQSFGASCRRVPFCC